MGWFKSNDSTKAELIAELSTAHPQDNSIVLETSVKGDRLWSLKQKKETGEKFITLHLLDAPESKHEGWGYKDTGVCRGAHGILDCPLSYVEQASPTDDQSTLEFRAGVRAYNKKLGVVRQSGDRINYAGSVYTLRYMVKRTWTVTEDGNSKPLTITARQLADSTPC
jgi:hypothetical protein